MSASEIGLAVAVLGPIVGVYMFLYKHATNNDRHVPKNDIDNLKNAVVYKDTCEAEKKSFIRQIEQNAELEMTRHDALVTLINTKFAALEKMIKNNGYHQ